MTRRTMLIKDIRRFARSRGLNMHMTEGANHTKVRVGERNSVIPRHSEINELTTRSIRPQLGMDS